MKNDKNHFHRSKSEIIGLFVVIAVIIMIAVLILCFAGRGDLPYDTSTQPSTLGQEGEESAPAPTHSHTENAPSETYTAMSAETEVPPETEDTKSTQSTAGKPASTKPTTSTATQKELTFPYSIPGTSLVIQKVDSYDGIFLEDGSDKDVEGIYALILKNTGTTGVEYASITLVKDGKELHFTATAMPAGATMVVQEASATAYQDDKFTKCTCEIALMETFEMSNELVSVAENEDGKLVVTNLTTKTIPCIRIFYKFYMSSARVYVGGITYTAKITELAGGDSYVITPSHYASGSSTLMMVRTYETTD